MKQSALLKRAGLSRRPQSLRLMSYTAWLLRFGFIRAEMVELLGGAEHAQESLPRMWDAATKLGLTPDDVIAEVKILLRDVPRGAPQYRARRDLIRWLAGVPAEQQTEQKAEQ